MLGVVRDVSKRIQAEQNLHQRVETRTHEQAKLLEISLILASTLEFQPGLILDQLREIIEYTHGGLFALEDTTLVTLAMRGTPQLEQSTPIRIHLQGPETLAALFNGHRPIRIADVWSDNPQAQFLRSLLRRWSRCAARRDAVVDVGTAGGERPHHRWHRRRGNQEELFHATPCRPGPERCQPGRDHHDQC